MNPANKKREMINAFEEAIVDMWNEHVDKYNEYVDPDSYKENSLKIHDLVDRCDAEVMEYYNSVEDEAHKKFGDKYDEVLTKLIDHIAERFVENFDLYKAIHG